MSEPDLLRQEILRWFDVTEDDLAALEASEFGRTSRQANEQFAHFRDVVIPERAATFAEQVES